MKHLFCTILFIGALHLGICQNHFIYYLDKDLKSTSKKSAFFNGIGEKENGTVKVSFFLINDLTQPAIIAHFNDSSLANYEGLFQSFYKNRQVESEGSFSNGEENGLWKKWNEEGRLTDSTMYANGKKMTEKKFYYYKNGKQSSYSFENNYDNTMVIFRYDDSGKIESKIKFLGNEGVETHYNKSDSSTIVVHTREEKEASFPGGDHEWTKYITKRIMENIDQLANAGVSGTCRIRFIVNKDGSIDNVEALTMQKSVLAKVAIDAVKSGPRWEPASQYGRLIKAYREQPVTFTVSSR